MQRYTTHAILGRGVAVLLCSLLLVPVAARGQVAVVVPLDEARFASPALPPPLWMTNTLVMTELTLLTIKTQLETDAEPLSRLRLKPSITTGALEYTYVRGNVGKLTLQDDVFGTGVRHHFDFDGDVLSAHAKVMWEMPGIRSRDRLAFGALVPYAHLDLDSFDANRIGVLPFGRYTLPVTNPLTKHEDLFLRVVLSGTYMYNDITSNIPGRDFDAFHTIGSTISVALGFDPTTSFELTNSRPPPSPYLAGSLALAYHVTDDNVRRESIDNGRVVDEVKEQHLLMLGANVGLRIANRPPLEHVALTLDVIWNHDATNYKGSLREADEDYVDIIAALAWSVSPAWRINVGYKKVLGYDDLDVDSIFAGLSGSW